MNGLLKNNFYSTLGSLKLFLCFLLLLSISVFVTGSSVLLFTFATIAAPGLSLLSIAGLRKEAASKWYKHKLSFPVKRKEIIHSFYISHTICTILGVILTTTVFVITVIFHGNNYFDLGLRDAITLITAGGVVSLIVGAIFCPLFYCVGAEKTEVIIVISFADAVGFLMFITWIINLMNGFQSVSDFQYYMSLLIVWIAAIVVFFLSSIIANVVYRRKEC